MLAADRAWDDIRSNYCRGKDSETAVRKFVEEARPKGIKVECELRRECSL